MYARLLDYDFGDWSPAQSSLRFIYAGGSPLDQTLKDRVERLFGRPLHNGYGMTESSPTISQTRIESPRHDTSVGSRSEERRVGKECVSTCRSGWARDH